MKQKHNRPHLLYFLITFTFLSGTLLLSSCTKNEATGTTQFNIVTEAEEIQLGNEYHPLIVAEYGGLYNNNTLTEKIRAIGEDYLVPLSGRSNLQYHFSLLDTHIINAFAVPGGYVYITRGILAQMNSEAELAFILGHEIGHIAAKHTAQFISQQRGYSLLEHLANLLLGKKTTEDFEPLVGQVTGLAILGYGRENELESDMLGYKMCTRADYNGLEATQILVTFQHLEQYEPNLFEVLLSTHPPTSERIKRIDKEIKKDPPDKKSYVGRNSYLKSIANLYIGTTPQAGWVDDEGYFNSYIGLRLPLNNDWKLESPLRFSEISFTHKSKANLQVHMQKYRPNINNPTNITCNSELTFLRHSLKGKRVYTFSKEVVDEWVSFQWNNHSQPISWEKGILCNMDLDQNLAQKNRLKVIETKQKTTLLEIAGKYGDTNKYLDKLSVFNDIEIEETIPKGTYIKLLPEI